MSTPEHAEAVKICREITAGAIPAYDGAKRIWVLFAEQPDEYPEEILVFVGLASEWEDSPGHRSAYEADIVEAAERFIADAAGCA